MKDQLLIKIINDIVQSEWRGAETVIHNVSSAFFLEVLSDKINNEDIASEYQKIYNAFDRHNGSCSKENIIIFHRVFLYKVSGDQFRVDGTLHTQESGYFDGMYTVTLSAGDAYVRLAEVDVQAHQYGATRPVKIRGIVLKTIDGENDIDEIHQDYKELEFSGMNCRIEKIERKVSGGNILNVFVYD